MTTSSTTYHEAIFGPGDVVELDGNTFIACTFGTGSILVYRGDNGPGTQIRSCAFERGCGFKFEGAALRTVRMLRHIWGYEGGQEMILFLLNGPTDGR